MNNSKMDIYDFFGMFFKDMKLINKSSIAVITSLGVIFFNMFKFIEYLNSNVLFSYYGLDVSLYKYNNQNFLFSIVLSIFGGFMMYALVFIIKQTFDNLSHKKIANFENFLNILLILFANFCFLFVSGYELNFVTIIIFQIGLTVVEIIYTIIICKMLSFFNKKNEKKEIMNKDEVKMEMKNIMKVFPFLIIFLIVDTYFLLNAIVRSKRSYYMYGNNKVVTYSTSDYYIVSDCKIEKKDLIINKGTQEKIDNKNIKVKLKKFKEVKVK